MGRRALKRIDKRVDYSWHLLEFDSLPDPFSLEALFPEPAPIVLEVGSGKGLFMQSESAARPGSNFLGVEISFSYARFCAAKLAQADRTNARMLAGDGEKLLRDFIGEGELDEVHVYFPDPWWKKRHHKRRVLNEQFLINVARTLRLEGELHFWTDVKEYFDATLELIEEKIPLEGPFDVPAAEPQDELDYRTHFERRTRLADQPVYRSLFRKNPGTAASGS